MTITKHFKEIQRRSFIILFSLIASIIISLLYSEELLFILTKPLLEISSNPTTEIFDSSHSSSRRFIFTDVTEVFITYLRMSITIAFFTQIPLIFYHTWHFKLPGLYKKERFFISRLFIGSIIFLTLSILFVYFIMIPIAWNFFLTYENNCLEGPFQLQLEAKVNEYVSLVVTLFMAVSFLFQLPVFLILLLYLKVVNLKGLMKQRRLFCIGSFILSALCSPPDIVSQLIMAIPLILLYELIIIIALIDEGYKKY